MILMLSKKKSEQKFVMSHWGAKEALYKLYGKGGISFKNDILLSPFSYQSIGNLTAR